MSMPVYVAKKLGDHHMLVRVDAPAIVLRTMEVGVGLGLIGFASSRRGWLGGLAAVAGATLTYHGWTGIDPFSRLLGPSAARHGSVAETPSQSGRPPGGGDVQIPADALEEAQMESFPASDPPASSRDHSVG